MLIYKKERLPRIFSIREILNILDLKWVWILEIFEETIALC